MKIASIIARSLLGLILVVFGANMFLNFIYMPPPPEGPAREFMTALFLSHYLYIVGAVQVVGGLILSQALTLYTTPVIYLQMARLSDAWQRFRGRQPKRAAAPAMP